MCSYISHYIRNILFTRSLHCLKRAQIIHLDDRFKQRQTFHIYKLYEKEFGTFSVSATAIMDNFKGTTDRFNGITVDTTVETCSPGDMKTKLESSLNQWKEERKKCIWFKVNISDAAWIPHLAEQGFNFHHAREGFVMMFRWLAEGKHNLPPGSHTNLGVGGLVINDANQVLAVTERNYEFPHWKLPGGYVERGEDIVDAAIREIKEETGIDTEAKSIVALRHSHGMMFDNSDIYVIVMLKPLSQAINICAKEIVECKWMDVDEYLNHPHVHKLNRKLIAKALEAESRKCCIKAEKMTVKYSSFVRDITFLSIDDL